MRFPSRFSNCRCRKQLANSVKNNDEIGVDDDDDGYDDVGNVDDDDDDGYDDVGNVDDDDDDGYDDVGNVDDDDDDGYDDVGNVDDDDDGGRAINLSKMTICNKKPNHLCQNLSFHDAHVTEKIIIIIIVVVFVLVVTNVFD